MTSLGDLVNHINAHGGLTTTQDVLNLYNTKLSDEQVQDVLNRLAAETNTIRDQRAQLTAITEIVLRTIRVALLA